MVWQKCSGIRRSYLDDENVTPEWDNTSQMRQKNCLTGLAFWVNPNWTPAVYYWRKFSYPSVPLLVT